MEGKLLDHLYKLRELSDSIKHNNICFIRIPEELKQEKWAEGVFELIIAQNFPTLGMETSIQVQEARRTPLKINKNRSTPRHIIVKITKDKDKNRILKPARDKRSLTSQGTHVRLATDLSTETCQARQEWHSIFRALNKTNMQPRILYPARPSFRIERKIQSFQDKQKLKDFVNTKPALQVILKETL